MPRRADSDRIQQAKRAATHERLVGEAIPRPLVEAWIASDEGGDADMDRAFGDPDVWDNPDHVTRAEFERGHAPPAAPARSSDGRGAIL